MKKKIAALEYSIHLQRSTMQMLEIDGTKLCATKFRTRYTVSWMNLSNPFKKILWTFCSLFAFRVIKSISPLFRYTSTTLEIDEEEKKSDSDEVSSSCHFAYMSNLKQKLSFAKIFETRIFLCFTWVFKSCSHFCNRNFCSVHFEWYTRQKCI